MIILPFRPDLLTRQGTGIFSADLLQDGRLVLHQRGEVKNSCNIHHTNRSNCGTAFIPDRGHDNGDSTIWSIFGSPLDFPVCCQCFFQDGPGIIGINYPAVLNPDTPDCPWTLR